MEEEVNCKWLEWLDKQYIRLCHGWKEMCITEGKRRADKIYKIAEYEMGVFWPTDLQIQIDRKQPKRRDTEKSRGLHERHTMTDWLYFDRFGDLLLGCSQHWLTADFRLEQRVHQSRLSQATLPCERKYSQRETNTHFKMTFFPPYSDGLCYRYRTAYTLLHRCHNKSKQGPLFPWQFGRLRAVGLLGWSSDKLQVSVCTNTASKAISTHDCNPNTPSIRQIGSKVNQVFFLKQPEALN